MSRPMPDVHNVVKIEELNVVIDVLAFRKLDDDELARSIAYFRSTKQGRRLKKNTKYTIISIIGARD